MLQLLMQNRASPFQLLIYLIIYYLAKKELKETLYTMVYGEQQEERKENRTRSS